MRRFKKMAEEVGASSRDVLGNIHHAAKELMRIALQCRVNAREVEESEETNLPSLVALKRQKEGLIRQHITISSELELRERLSEEPLGDASVSEDKESLDTLKRRVKSLKNELHSAKSHYHRNTMLLECLQRSELLTKHIFPATTRPQSTNDRSLCSLVEVQAGLVSEVLRNGEEVGSLQADITALQRQRVEAQGRCRELSARIEGAQASQPSEDPHSQRLQERLTALTSEATLLRHTLQSLIVGSGVDWAVEDTLMELTLSLGRPFPWQ